MLDIVLIVISALCLIAGLAGCILPFLPGPPIAYLGLVFLHLTDKVQYSTTQFIVWLLIVAVLQVLDYFTPMLGSKYSGGSKWGNWGCRRSSRNHTFLSRQHLLPHTHYRRPGGAQMESYERFLNYFNKE